MRSMWCGMPWEQPPHWITWPHENCNHCITTWDMYAGVKLVPIPSQTETPGGSFLTRQVLNTWKEHPMLPRDLSQRIANDWKRAGQWQNEFIEVFLEEMGLNTFLEGCEACSNVRKLNWPTEPLGHNFSWDEPHEMCMTSPEVCVLAEYSERGHVGRSAGCSFQDHQTHPVWQPRAHGGWNHIQTGGLFLWPGNPAQSSQKHLQISFGFAWKFT